MTNKLIYNVLIKGKGINFIEAVVAEKVRLSKAGDLLFWDSNPNGFYTMVKGYSAQYWLKYEIDETSFIEANS